MHVHIIRADFLQDRLDSFAVVVEGIFGVQDDVIKICHNVVEEIKNFVHFFLKNVA